MTLTWDKNTQNPGPGVNEAMSIIDNDEQARAIRSKWLFCH
jgi:hypothetical protein